MEHLHLVHVGVVAEEVLLPPALAEQYTIDARWGMREGGFGDLAEDDRAKALIVYIDSPGGTTYGGEELFHSLREIASEKPVVAVIGTLGTSAGYLVALAGERIFARGFRAHVFFRAWFAGDPQGDPRVAGI